MTLCHAEPLLGSEVIDMPSHFMYLAVASKAHQMLAMLITESEMRVLCHWLGCTERQAHVSDEMGNSCE